MARPFGLKKDPEEKEKQKNDASNNSEKAAQDVKHSSARVNKTCENSFRFKKGNSAFSEKGKDLISNLEGTQYVEYSDDRVDGVWKNSSRFKKENLTLDERSEELATSIYHVPNFVNCGPTVINMVDNRNVKNNMLSKFSKEVTETGRRIKVRKGVFASRRIVNTEDIHIIAEDLRNDWKKLLKMLPGVTFNNSSFHQTFIDAMDRNESTNMAEITLRTWKHALPEFSTIGNLAKTLFKIEHPDLVTYLKP